MTLLIFFPFNDVTNSPLPKKKLISYSDHVTCVCFPLILGMSNDMLLVEEEDEEIERLIEEELNLLTEDDLLDVVDNDETEFQVCFVKLPGNKPLVKKCF